MNHERKKSRLEQEMDKIKIEKLYLDLVPKIPESKEVCKLILPDGKEYEFPILKGSDGPPMIDIRNLYTKTGYFTYDPGFTCTGSCVSQITFIDGEKGELMYRGYRIQDLAEQCDFVDSCYLLLYGQLPSKNDKKQFEDAIKSEMLVNDQLISFYKGFQTGAHPMAIMVGVVGALSAFMHDGLEVRDAVQRENAAIKMVAKMPMIAAIAYRTAMGLPIVYPNKKLSFSENFLYMMFSDPMDKDYQVDSYLAKVLDTILLLHADHEQNASTATVRIAGSSYANPFACVAAGIASLWGPAHGGANEAVLDMLDEIGSLDNVAECVRRAKDKNSNFRLMGFGHRVYKNYDPRAEVMRDMCHKVLEYLNIKDDPYLSIGLELEKVALQDPYFIERKLYPNVDFYSGIVLNAIGIPKSMFTVLFALARSIGWITQWREMISEPVIKIGRPRQLYVGYPKRDMQPIEKREDTYSELSVSTPPPKKGFYLSKP
jgi:citrate synthase